ncbi:MAG: AzlD domain-containing protein [Cardiobacteriaceae bacterium]|nr:AzlD domain-containing protein [Cardiobacteriaceae bacterium]
MIIHNSIDTVINQDYFLNNILPEKGNYYFISAIILAALATVFLRSLPFLLLKKVEKYKAQIDFIAAVMPAGIMLILAAYCLFFSVRKGSFLEITVSFISLFILIFAEYRLHRPVFSILLGLFIYVMGQSFIAIH